ncbi:MAG: methylglyoxal synthase [Caldithrix sp.]|nr:methylglyoxal synthase [Caldithrix sp.]
MQEHTIKMPAKKRIALVAHDNRKADLVEWVNHNRALLSRHELFGTGTTGRRIAEEVGLNVHCYKSGPLGGDQQIGAKIAELGIDMLIFFWDPLEAQPHDVDVKALLRIAVVYNVPMAGNRSTADFLVTSPFMEEDYQRQLEDYKHRIGLKK